MNDATRMLPSGKMPSRLCFGSLTISPLQANLPPEQGADLLLYAASLGVNFVDTADLYGTYPAIRLALRECDMIVSTKSYAYDEETAEASFRRAVEGIGREYIDVFLLHEQESEHTLRGHARALEWFHKKKREGLIGTVGISTHHVAAVRAAVRHGGIEALHPLINHAGIGIADGTREDMEAALQNADEAGMFIYGMKALAGGHLIAERQAAFAYALGFAPLHAVALGMQSKAEIDYAAALFSGKAPDESLAIDAQRRLLIHAWCEGCGKCVERCGQKALSLANGKATVDAAKCVLCGYCAAACPQFCIKVV